ncbi:hypothetical protein E2562_012460 [Oryza meyeriana var. granulata]|uniref:Uncharacterized protein n=1 Tax=Oryza meyeriana var. granulata TaxID=110450 RepID=A0A6G1C6M6_9ORYZ|nr:hypothetical protein E2562_012460 [Oryza meyeriana var. granulata]
MAAMVGARRALLAARYPPRGALASPVRRVDSPPSLPADRGWLRPLVPHRGYVDEAREFVEQMPVEPNVDVWEKKPKKSDKGRVLEFVHTSHGDGGWRRTASPRGAALGFGFQDLLPAAGSGGDSFSGAGGLRSASRPSPAPRDLEGPGGGARRRAWVDAAAQRHGVGSAHIHARA